MTSPPVASRFPRPLGSGDNASVDRGAIAYYNNQCAAPRGNRWGNYDGTQATANGMYVYEQTPDGGMAWMRDTYNAGYDCISAAAWVDSNHTCVYDFTAVINGPRNNPEVAATNFFRRTQTTPFARRGSSNLTLCNNSYQMAVSEPLRYYGRYLLTIQPRVVRCTYRTFYKVDARTQTVPANRMLGCTSPVRQSAVEFRAQLFCTPPGWSPDWSGSHSFTTADCDSSTNRPGIWSCGPNLNRTPLVSGHRSPVSVYGDGRDRALRWRTVTPTGDLRRIQDRETRLWFRSGSPFRTTVGAGHSTQPFVSQPRINSWVPGWRAEAPDNSTNTDFLTNWQAAGIAGEPWTARAQWKFTAEFRFTEVTITSVNIRTGQMETTTRSVWRRIPAQCTGAPVEVNAVHARNSNN